ncbi:lytic transglycosylase domain-containing protein [Campylobacter coli]|uniref:Lytic transglycosylase domain-containing protein n=1 Tax=Campylobacter coli TaxID=195 RepID=A0A644SA50_CAMCO|nr:lytic transglycosylase domain-containing protein [Campylobacter coli]EAI3824135.1 lytic transglycosylase domain-containing protein [Campylobacter coli]EAI5446921.1 lytic transglycosylase domain-containing protein [Campylobacter coli]EAJ2630383.1 lytic transglycosylase domain-containing protein [Campylobacter coli]EAJ9198237.1 lytic transglycosylase domain-containing protein [Campylobacter coli]
MKKIFFLITLLFANLLFAQKNYFVQAGEKFGINPQLLWAIAYKESRLTPNIISKPNKNGTYDIGIMQINSIHLPRLKKQYSISENDLLRPKINIFIGAEILKMCLDKHGLNEKGITCYNGRIANNPYGREVIELLKKARNANGKIN